MVFIPPRRAPARKVEPSTPVRMVRSTDCDVSAELLSSGHFMLKLDRGTGAVSASISRADLTFLFDLADTAEVIA